MQKTEKIFIKVYDENGKYAINPEDCPIMIDDVKYGMIVYDLDGNITLCPRPSWGNLKLDCYSENQIISCNLKDGFVGTYFKNKGLFINHPKYGIIKNPSYNSFEECFEAYNVDEDNVGFGMASDLFKLDQQILLDFAKKTFNYVKDNSDKSDYDINERLELAWQSCFGQYYDIHPNVDKLNEFSKEELVYFILGCENYGVVYNNEDHSLFDLRIHGIFQEKDEEEEEEDDLYH